VSATMYTEYGIEPTDVEHWEHPLRSAEPDKLVARDVRLKGFCLRQLSAENAERMKRMYKKKGA
jgi:hypothetical protein